MKPKSGLTRFHNCYILRDSKIIKEDLWIREGKVENPEFIFYVEQLEADVTVNCDDLLIAPGFIDIQINGKILFKLYIKRCIECINSFVTLI